MKWYILALIVLAAPTIAAWLRTNPKNAPFVWGLLGFLPFVLGPWHLIIAPYATPMWSGYVKGWEVSALDSVALGIIFGTRGRWGPLTLVLPFLAYIFAVIVAVPQARFGHLALSYPFQLTRALFVFLAVSRVVVSERGERAVLTGLIAGLALQAGYAIFDHAGGAIQSGGSLGHQNLLGFLSHMVLMPAFAMLVAGRWKWEALVGVLAGVTVVILTASRATIAFGTVGLALTLLFSITVGFTARKAMIAVLGVLLLAASYPLAQAALAHRFENQTTKMFAEDKEREAFERAAYAMLTAKPLGVGPNHYVFIANTEGYSERAGVAWRTQSRSTNVHNSYLLVAAETGYLGLITMLSLLGSAIGYAFWTAIRFRRQPGAEVLIGVGCGITAICLHGLYEWMFVVYPTQYVFAVSLGIISGLRNRFLQRVAESSRAKRSERKIQRQTLMSTT